MCIYISMKTTVTLQEDCKLTYENKALRRIFGTKKVVQQDRQNYVMKSFIICTLN